jgi:hypothetical protein
LREPLGLAATLTNEEQIHLVVSLFPSSVANFPLKYHGIPLSIKKLPKSSLQPLVDMVDDNLLVSKDRLMNQSERLTLIKTTLSVVPI